MGINKNDVLDVNAHLHTPYSFSAFGELAEALDQAAVEGVKVVGVNDFYTMAGYEEWAEGARARKLYPLFNIEMIALQADDQANGVRVNDPANPGRTYLSGKGLCYPVSMPEPFAGRLAMLAEFSNDHSRAMCSKMNEVLAACGMNFRLDFEEIKLRQTKGSVRERHLAKALRIAAYEAAGGDMAEARTMLEKIFGGTELKSVPENHAAVENEIRNNLLKAGKAAFLSEDPKAFLPVEEVRAMIIAAGGIPTYPFLADDAKGEFTDYERDLNATIASLRERGIWSVEFITTRNTIEVLERYAGRLFDEGFVVTFGTEHNTPAPEPILLHARDGRELTDVLRQINYCGACVVAAHQERLKAGEEGYLDAKGDARTELRGQFAEEGDRIIKKSIEG